MKAAVSSSPRPFTPTPRTVRLATEIMSWPVVSVSWRCSVEEASALLARRPQIHHLLVVDGPRPVGVLCECDLWHPPADKSVSRVTSPHPMFVDEHATIGQAGRIMLKKRVGCLPVVVDGRPLGMITRGDLLRVGAIAEDQLPKCASCGSRRHVRRLAGGARTHCRKCTDEPLDADELYVDIGGSE